MSETLSSLAVDKFEENKCADTCIQCGGKLIPTEQHLHDTRFGIDYECGAAICTACGLEQIFPVPGDEDLKQYYENFYNFKGSDTSKYERLRQSFLFSPFYRFWMAVDGDVSFFSYSGKGRLLDVGCNEGRGLTFYCKNGFCVEGLELNRVAAKSARSRGFVVHEGILDSFEPNSQYNVVVLSNVLEHSLNPAAMLEDISRILAPGGLVWISCPNSRSWLRKLFGAYWINWHVPFHISHFSAVTLRALLEKHGFTIESAHDETPALWVAYSIIAGLCSKRGSLTRTLRKPMILAALMLLVRGIFFPLLWIGNQMGRGDCLVVEAKKLN
jgi:2-polyprenyl-3-methyl-5-hydroxy-6-metoxy-1,4-benzoquinol methylase